MAIVKAEERGMRKEEEMPELRRLWFCPRCRTFIPNEGQERRCECVNRPPTKQYDPSKPIVFDIDYAVESVSVWVDAVEADRLLKG